MDRRSVLFAAAALLAGCGARGQGEKIAARAESPTPEKPSPSTPTERTSTPTPTGTSTTTEAQYRPAKARTGIGTARERLKAATSALKTEFARMNYASRSPQFDETPVRVAIDRARESLRTATRVATPEQKAVVEALNDYIEFLETLLNAVATFEDSLTARPRVTALREEHDEAASDLRRARSRLREMRSQRELVQVKFRTARQKLADSEAVGLAVARDTLDLLDTLVADIETLYDGDREIERGWSDYHNGLEDYGDRFLSASAFAKSERHFGRAAYVFGRHASELPSDTSEADRLIELIGDGSAGGSYTFTVDGELRGMSTNAADSVDGRTATGKVDGERDRYAFSGSITSFEADEGVTVYVDGQRVDPAILGSNGTPDLTNTIVIVGTGSTAEYRFTVSETIVKNDERGSINEGDTIEGTTATGVVGGGNDAYDYAGVITDFRISGDASVEINGEAVDPTTLAPDPNPDPRASLVPLFRRRECQSDSYRTAADKMHRAALLEEHSPEKAEDLEDEADAANDRAESDCGS